MHFKLAYIKLTLFYVLIVMAISLTFSIVLYNVSSKELGRGLNRQARVFKDIPINIDDQSGMMLNFDQIRLEQLEESNNHLKLNLFYYNLLILSLSSGISYFLARKTLRPIEEMVEAQNMFTADASHELRTPLTAMRTEIEVNLRDKNLKISDAKNLLASNLEEIGKLESLSGALLKLAHYREDNEIKKTLFPLGEIATEAYEKVEKNAESKSITFKNDFNEALISGDKQSLVELFIIIFDNAIKYSPSKSKISLSAEVDSNNTIVKIKDQGIGIKASDLHYIFNRFYRADTSRTKEKTEGYGLGLSIAKRIVDLHKGTITADSKPSEGSEFTIKLPYKKENS